MQLLLGLSGKKVAGKSTITQYLKRNRMEMFPDGCDVELFPLAKPLKELAISVLGLRPEQVYGTEEDKRTLTKYRWEDLPHYDNLIHELNERNEQFIDLHVWDGDEAVRIEKLQGYLEPPAGLMTAREVLQEVGTGIFRRMYFDIWAEACLRSIREWFDRKANFHQIAVIDDVRFPNEVKAIQKVGGKVVRLTRNVLHDNHESETALDEYSDFTWVLDNSLLSITEQCEAVRAKVIEWSI